jgi:hypothetical protein
LYDDSRFRASTKERKDDAVVWRATTLSTRTSSDLRPAIDYLLVPTFEYFGEDTGKQVRQVLSARDKRVTALRKRARAEAVVK